MPTADPTRSEDHALLARVADGDRIALEMLYRRHARWLTARLQARCGDPDLTDLAVQDTFLAVWKSAKKFRGDGDVGAWIWGIGARRLVDQLRRRRAAPIDPATIALDLDAASPWPSSEEEHLASGGDATAAVASLEPDLRAVFVLTVIDGLSTKEAARVLGIPQGTVKTRAMRARQRLRIDLADLADHADLANPDASADDAGTTPPPAGGDLR